MNMKKLMAVVMAVAIAISAMAINVFAGENDTTARIDLINEKSNTTITTTATWTFEVPIYNLYGYANYNNYMEVRLPNVLDVNAVAKAEWSITIGDYTTTLKSLTPDGHYNPTQWQNEDCSADLTDNAEPWNNSANIKYFTQYVNFGAFVRPYYYAGGDQWATVPQSQMVGDYNSVKFTAKVTYNGDKDLSLPDTWRIATNQMYVQMWSAGDDGVKNYNEADDVKITGSMTPAAYMAIAKSASTGSNTADATNRNWLTTANEAVNLVWDHTLANRDLIITADEAKLVVELDKPIKGLAAYILKATDQSGNQQGTIANLGNSSVGSTAVDAWWNFSSITYKTVSSPVIVNGQISVLEFPLDMSVLYNDTYGVFNAYFNIEELLRGAIADDVMEKTFGYKTDYPGNHKANAAYIELTYYGESDNAVIEDPVEPTDVDEVPEEPDTTEIPDEPSTTEPDDSRDPMDRNPGTGITLAVLPMVVAAAAVVASKRR